MRASPNERTFAVTPTSRSSDRYVDDDPGRRSYRSILPTDGWPLASGVEGLAEEAVTDGAADHLHGVTLRGVAGHHAEPALRG